MAQEESHSISENIKWSLQKNFRSGTPQINLKRMIGYDMCKDKNWGTFTEDSTKEQAEERLQGNLMNRDVRLHTAKNGVVTQLC